MNRKRTFLIFIFLTTAASFDAAYAQNVSEAPPDVSLSRTTDRVHNDIEAAKKRLIDTRQRIANERLEKIAELTRLEDEVARLREQWRNHAQITDAGTGRFRELYQEPQSLEHLLDGAWSTLVEARRNAETHFSLLDRKVLESDLKQTDTLLLDRQDDAASPEKSGRAVLALLLAHVRACSSIRQTPGTAIDDAGKEQSGVFIQIGGIGALFASKSESGSCGLVRMQHGSSHPHVWPLSMDNGKEAILRLVNGEAAMVPLDITGGAALRSLGAKRTLSEEVRAGGSVMVPILVLALICASVGLWKFCRLWWIPVSSDSRVVPFARSLFSNREKADEMVDRTRGPLHRLLTDAFAHADKPRDQLEEVLQEAILTEVPRLESKLSFLSVGAAIAPLLGLLGTVTGMIHTFRLISVFGSGDARMLSGGISEALVTTEAGLIVAIPLLLLHAVLIRRVRTIADGLEKGALTILNECPAATPRTGSAS